MSKIRVTLITMTLMSLVSGCIPIPVNTHTGLHKTIEAETITFIQVGTTTREDVLLRLGAPDWASEHRFVYGTEKLSVVVIGVLFPFPPTGVGLKYRALVIEFDAHAVVTAWGFGKGATDPTAMPAWTTAGEVIVGADPYVQPLRQKALFAYPNAEPFSLRFTAVFPSGNLTAAGILPMRLSVENRATQRVVVPTSSIMLELSDGRRLDPASGQAVADHLPPLRDAPLVRGVLRRRYQSIELRDVTLGAHQSGHGFMYCILPRDIGSREALAAGVTIEMRLTAREEATPRVIRLLLKGQG